MPRAWQAKRRWPNPRGSALLLPNFAHSLPPCLQCVGDGSPIIIVLLAVSRVTTDYVCGRMYVVRRGWSREGRQKKRHTGSARTRDEWLTRDNEGVSCVPEMGDQGGGGDVLVEGRERAQALPSGLSWTRKQSQRKCLSPAGRSVAGAVNWLAAGIQERWSDPRCGMQRHSLLPATTALA